MSLFGNPKQQQKYIWIFIAIFAIACGFSTCAKGAEFELAGGVTVVRGTAPVAAATVIWPRQIGNIDLYAGVVLIGESTYEGERQMNQAFFRAGVTAHIGKFGVTLGAAVPQHADEYTSGRLNFNLGFSYELGKAVTQIIHFSNAGTSKPNKGRDMVLAGWRFRQQ